MGGWRLIGYERQLVPHSDIRNGPRLSKCKRTVFKMDLNPKKGSVRYSV
jgi:hypothetical protein